MSENLKSLCDETVCVSEGKLLETVKLPLYNQSDKTKKVFDLRNLDPSIQFFCPGLDNIAPVESAISNLNGSLGVLKYRGYKIEDLAANKSYVEVVYLLLFGLLPNSNELTEFKKSVRSKQKLSASLKRVIASFDVNTHPMIIIIAAVSALSAENIDHWNVSSVEMQNDAILNLFAKIPLIVAASYRVSKGLDILDSDAEDYSDNFYASCFGKQADKMQRDAIDLIFTLHAEHSQNASTTAAQVAGSTGSNPYAVVISGIATLWGPSHGGANEACLTMLESIIDKGLSAEQVIEEVKTQKIRLMGFGHRVYKSYDPRARQIQNYRISCWILQVRVWMSSC